MVIKLINNFQDFLSLEGIWGGILEKSRSDQVFLTFEWVKSWWLAFGKDCLLNILLVTEDDAVIGIAPLMIKKINFLGLRLKKLGFIYNDNASHADFLLMSGKEKDGLCAIIGYLKSEKPPYDIIELLNVPMESPNYGIMLEKLKKGNFLFVLKDGLRSPYLPIETGWQAYISKRSRKLRSAIRYNHNKVKKSTQYQIERPENPKDEITDYIADISAKCWKARRKGDISCSEENKIFFKALSRAAAKKGWLNIWLLKFNGKAIAYEYCLKYKNKIYALRSDFDEDYRFASPGVILNIGLIRSCFEDNLSELDFCGHEDEYKKRWTSSLREHRHIVIYGGLYAKIIYLADYLIYYKAKKFLKRFKFIVKLKQNLYR